MVIEEKLRYNREKAKRYYLKNSEKCKERSKKYRENNSEKIKAAMSKWKKDNPDKYRESKKKSDVKWVKNNPDKYRKYQREYARVYRRGKSFNKYKKQYESINKLKIKERRKQYWKKIKSIPKEYSKVLIRRKANYHILIPKNQLCQICHKRKAIHRHHSSYLKPLEVLFLCSRCHKQAHYI